MKNQTLRLSRMALLTAAALAIHAAEAQIPLPFPVPGLKLGLANIVTVFALFRMGRRDTLLILIARIMLGSLFSGGLSAMLYSLAGGLLCYLSIALLLPLLSEHQIWVAGVVGALFHNIGQVLVAIPIVGNLRIAFYLPVLLAVSIPTGALTGLTAQHLHLRLPPFDSGTTS